MEPHQSSPSVEPGAPDALIRLLLLAYLAFLVYASLYPIASFRPPDESPLTLLFETVRISRTDLLGNLLVYIPLGFFLAARKPALSPLGATLFGCGLSFGIEYLQAFLPGRVPSLTDWGLNTAGTLVGAGLGSRVARVRVPISELLNVAEPRAWLGLAAVGTWVSSQLFPFVPTVDIGYLRGGLSPVWHVLQGTDSFSPTQAAVYAFATLSLSTILVQCLRPNHRFRLLVPLAFLAVLLAKVPIVTRQLSLEALAGVLAGLWISRQFADSKPSGRLPFLAALGAFLVDGLRSEGSGAEAALQPFNWIPLRTHLTSELIGAADILSTAWPFLAMAFAASGSKSIPPRRAAVGGGALVFAVVMAVEWVQGFLPGRTPDVTDALVAASAWLFAWYGISGSGRASGPRPVPEDRLPTPAPPPLPRSEPR